MILAIDVDYSDTGASVAGVLFPTWEAKKAVAEYKTIVHQVAEYEPGSFYKRELPCIMSLLDTIDASSPEDPYSTRDLSTIVVDGYVWLDHQGRMGLGAYLYDELDRRIPVVVVAKTSFESSQHAWHVLRGKSSKPLFVTAAGLDPHHAAECVRSMHGPYRIPTHLKRVDQLCRGRA